MSIMPLSQYSSGFCRLSTYYVFVISICIMPLPSPYPSRLRRLSSSSPRHPLTSNTHHASIFPNDPSTFSISKYPIMPLSPPELNYGLTILGPRACLDHLENLNYALTILGPQACLKHLKNLKRALTVLGPQAYLHDLKNLKHAIIVSRPQAANVLFHLQEPNHAFTVFRSQLSFHNLKVRQASTLPRPVKLSHSSGPSSFHTLKIVHASIPPIIQVLNHITSIILSHRSFKYSIMPLYSISR